MIIVRIKGGLGNQLFQYACGRALSRRNGDILKLDITEWSLNREKIRQYLLPNFNILENIAGYEEIETLRYPYGYLSWFLEKVKFRILKNYNVSFNRKIPLKKGDVYLDGYWQSERYFTDYSDIIRKELMPKKRLCPDAQILIRQIMSDNASICVHIRRGDNAHNPASMRLFGTPSKEYYMRAVHIVADAMIKNPSAKPNLYIFSDEIEWVKDNLHLDFPTTFVSRPSIADWEELPLMSACRHHVISNSTFSWWGAWLNPRADKIVVAPKRWALMSKHNFKDIIPSEWISI